MQEFVVIVCVLAAGFFVFRRYAPASWRRALLRLGARVVGGLGLKTAQASLLRMEAEKSAAAGCGACANSGSTVAAKKTFTFSAEDLMRTLPRRKR